MISLWKEDLSLGIKVIDDQHKMFVETMGGLATAIDEMKAHEVIDKVLKSLDEYAKYHFETEEGYFSQFGYAGAAEHIDAHNKFRRELRGMMDVQGDYLDRAAKLLDFMENWLVDHLDRMDKKYVECFREHGLN